MSDFLWPHGLQHARFPGSSLSPRVCSNSCPLSQWCHLLRHSLLLSSPFAFSLSQHQGFSNESALPIRWLKYWSFSFSISPFCEYSGLIFLWSWLVWSPCCPRDSQESYSAPQFESINSLALSLLYEVQLSHPYMTTGKTTALTIQTFVGKVKSLLFNILSRFFITSLPRSECLLILWPQSPSAVILEPRK